MRESGASSVEAWPVRHGGLGLTMGVEEEFVLADAVTREPALAADAVVTEAGRLAGVRHVVAELAQAQVETVSGVCTDARELRAEIARLRRCTARAAHESGCLLVASGTSALGSPGPPPVLDKPRYHTIAARFGPLLEQLCANACHVHIGVADREEAVQVVNHLRLWTPVLLALTTNSPFCDGRDTTHASWRSMLWGRWPTATPPPYLRSVEHYEQTVSMLVDSGAAVDPGMIYWSVRPSRHVPTVEIRVADVMPTVCDTVGYTLLVRALVAAALVQVRKGRAAPPVEDAVLRAALWRAARDGLAGQTLTVPLGGPPRLVPASYMVTALLRHTRHHLEATGDARTVLRWLTLLWVHGTGAVRQHAAYRSGKRLEDAVDAVVVGTQDSAHGVGA